jgi:hypothetical protein
LRRLVVHSDNWATVTTNFTEQFQSLAELEMSLLFHGPLKLHPLNQGLTRLRLVNTRMSGEHLICVITQRPASHTDDTDGGSPLVELELTYLSLEPVTDGWMTCGKRNYLIDQYAVIC